jgi:hypothetical protein
MALPTNVMQIMDNRPSNFRPSKIGNTTLTSGNKRTLRLKPMEGGAKASTGLVDKRLFTGDNELYAIMNEESNLWYLKQNDGAVDPRLREKRWTSFKTLMTDVVPYYRNRNVEVTEDYAEQSSAINRV